MKKNFKQIALILAVVVLYGLIALRFTELSDGGDYQVSAQSWNIESVDVDQAKKYELSLDYPDPFKVKSRRASSSISCKEVPIQSSSKEYKRSVRKQDKEIEIKPIKLVGTVYTQDPSQDMCILESDNHEFILKMGDSLNGYCIRKIYHDSVQVLRGQELETIKTKR